MRRKFRSMLIRLVLNRVTSRFKDLNHDGVINDADRTVIGNPNPSHLFSMSNILTWKRI
jgi:hypothetical protein